MSSGDQTALNQQLVNLLSKCARSDEQAFKTIYSLTSAHLFAVLVRALGMNETAEQALQDTFVTVWLKAGEYKAEKSQPMTWLTGIARSQSREIVRYRYTQSGTAVSLPETKPLPTVTAQMEFSNECKAAQSLEMGLNKLDAATRDCIVQAYAAGLSHEELCELHDTSVVSVKDWIRNGLLSMRGAFNGHS